jgi:predicted GNAT family N-acyltransferase
VIDLVNCDGKMVQVMDSSGRIFTGIAEEQSNDYCLHEYGRDEEAVEVCNYTIFVSDMKEIRFLPELKIIRATETWQRAGAYYVRIQAMAKKHHITLRAEFDEHDRPDTRYIVVTDHDFPIATARMYPLDGNAMMIGRVVVLPEYRHQGIGTMVVDACEEWAEELNCSKTVVESRDNKMKFYEELGYEVKGEMADGDTFRCIRMEKTL